MKVSALLKAAELACSVDLEKKLSDVEVTAVTADSRRAGKDSLFVALLGTELDGRNYVADAVARGCRVVLSEGAEENLWPDAETSQQKSALSTPTHTPAGQEVLYLPVADARSAHARLCAALAGFPARAMIMIGITGTNGKTTSAYLLEELIRSSGGEPGVIGTVNYRYRGQLIPALHTTPEPESLQRLLRAMADAGVTHVIMEVSSHALDQRRVEGIFFDLALFTNLSHEHLDYHGDMTHYFACKKRLFLNHLKPGGAAVVVVGHEQEGDEKENWGRSLIAALQALTVSGDRSFSSKPGLRLFRCGGNDGDLRVLTSHSSLRGIEAQVNGVAGLWTLRSTLVGDFNLDNLLGVAGLGLALGLSAEQLSAGLAKAKGAPGRLERFSSQRGVEVFVDYAHTPDALAQVLRTLRREATKRLIVVFGCGGDRDRTKRPLMGQVAANLADIVILTSDNPRNEQATAIMAAIERGLLNGGLARCRLESLLGSSHPRKGYDLVVSRRQAIRDTLLLTRPGDVVAICGKGHETTQTVAGCSRFFDDRQEVMEQLAALPVAALPNAKDCRAN